MRFECDRCHTKYSIPDERVRGKLLKIRCKTCGHVITVGGRPKAAGKKADAGSSPTARARGVRGRASAIGLPPSTMNVPAAASDRRLADLDEDLDGDKTVVSSPGVDIQALRASLAAEQGHTMEAPAQTGQFEPEEWYLADDYGQYGPMTFSELVARIRRRELGPNPQVWREGLADWKDLDEVPELRPHLKHLPPPRKTRPQEDSSPRYAMPPLRPEPAAGEGHGSPTAAEPASPRRKTGAATAAFFGSTTLDEVPGDASQGGAGPEAAVPPLGGPVAPLPATKDRSQAIVLVVAVTSVAVLALVVLAIYLLTKSGTQSPSQPRVASSEPQQRQPTNEQPARPGPSQTGKTAPGGTEQAGGNGSGQGEEEEDMVMEPVTIALPRAGARRAGRQAGKSSSGKSTSSSRSSSGSSSDFSFASPTGFGAPALPGRHATVPTPRVSSGGAGPAPRATRKVTKPEVVAVIRRHVYKLKRCYERAVRLHPTELRRAKMKVSIRISASGRVTSVSIRPGKYRGLSLGGCIVSEIKSWRFPPSTRSYATGFPLSFVGR